jgi:hypothetical protein
VNWETFLLIAKARQRVVGMLLAYDYRDRHSNFVYIRYLVVMDRKARKGGEELIPPNIGGELVDELVRIQTASATKGPPMRFLAEVDDHAEPDSSSHHITPEERTKRRGRIRLFSTLAAFAKMELRCLDYKPIFARFPAVLRPGLPFWPACATANRA